MEIVPGIHRLESRVGPRRLFQHVLVGDRILLVDSGMAQTPAELLFPYLRSIGRDPELIDYLLITHPDSDHFGGNAAIRRTMRWGVILCSRADRHMIEDPDVLVRERYSRYEEDHGICYPPEDKAWLRAVAGDATAVDITVEGGEEILLARDWRVRILLTPGHARGHLSLFDERSRTAIIGDAALWRGLTDANGALMLPSFYVLPAAYLATIQLLENLDLKTLLTSHYQTLGGDEIRRFLAESREFCLRAQDLLVQLLANSHTPLSLRQIIDALNPRLGPFPSPHERDLAYPLYGHLSELISLGCVEELRDARPVRYRLSA